MIRIVDYGLGNIQAFINLYKRNGFEIATAREAGELEDARKIILPGVGSFDHAMQLLNASGIRDMLERCVLERLVPVLGVCVGMQILADASDEGQERGLGWIAGRVRALRSAQAASNKPLPMPHMGWNDVRPTPGNPLFSGLQTGAMFYFLHSFYFDSEEPAVIGARCDYGAEFGCAVRSGHIHGVQFHPEKSHGFGVRLLKNFAEV